MKLNKLLSGIYGQKIDKKYSQLIIKSIDDDSRKVRLGSLFVALEGKTQNGIYYVDEAIRRGAKVVVYSRHASLSSLKQNICYLAVDNPREFLKKILIKFYGEPNKKVKAIAVTGTNGKTTTTFLLDSILKAAEKSTAILGTISYKVGKNKIASTNTTPGLVDNAKFFNQFQRKKIKYALMEVSSHALDQGRTDLLNFQSAIFTNLTRDHLDYHKTFENYFQSKAKLFKNLSLSACAVINLDDDYGRKLLKLTKAKIFTYAIKQKAMFRAENISLSLKKSRFDLIYPKGKIVVQTPLFGLHNIYNILGCIASAYSIGISIKNISQGIKDLKFVPGRLERVAAGQGFAVFIDYAHTPDALENVLTTIRRTSASSKIILVFGCGGDRDKTKRPKMAEVACHLADFSLVTSDNPRGENPESIIKEVIVGFKNKNYKVVVDRTLAIKEALCMARTNDIVLIAGKGHEMYQIFKDKTVPFDERKIVRGILSDV